MGDLNAGLVSGVHTTGPGAGNSEAPQVTCVFSSPAPPNVVQPPQRKPRPRPCQLTKHPAHRTNRLAGGQQYAATDSGVSIEQLASLDEKGVAQWVHNLSPKLAPFAPLFEQHQIEGALFLRLTDDMLREMGINRARATLALPPGLPLSLPEALHRALSRRAIKLTAAPSLFLMQ